MSGMKVHRVQGGLLRGCEEGDVPGGLPSAHTHALTQLCFVSLGEILKTHIAHWRSPYSMRLTYASISDSRVPVMELPTYTSSVYPP